MNIPYDDMKPYIPDFQYFLSNATTEDEDKYKTSVVIKCWFIVVKYIKDPVMREKLFEVVKLLHDSIEENTAIEYLDIFMKYLANTDNEVTKTDAVKAIETIFLDRGADMIKGWAKEYVEEGREEGIKEGIREGIREGRKEESKAMLLEAIKARYNYIREDIPQKIANIKSIEVIKSLLTRTYAIDSLDEFNKLIDESISTQ